MLIRMVSEAKSGERLFFSCKQLTSTFLFLKGVLLILFQVSGHGGVKNENKDNNECRYFPSLSEAVAQLKP